MTDCGNAICEQNSSKLCCQSPSLVLYILLLTDYSRESLPLNESVIQWQGLSVPIEKKYFINEKVMKMQRGSRILFM